MVDLPEVTDIEALVALDRASGAGAEHAAGQGLSSRSRASRCACWCSRSASGCALQFDRPWGAAQRQIAARRDRRAGRHRCATRSVPYWLWDGRGLMHVVFRESHGLEETGDAGRSRSGSGRSRGAVVLRQRPRRFRGGLAARAETACRRCGSPIWSRCAIRSRSIPMSNARCRAQRHPGPPDRRRILLALRARALHELARSSAASRLPSCRPTAATTRGSMRSRPLPVSTLRRLQICAMPAARWRRRRRCAAGAGVRTLRRACVRRDRSRPTSVSTDPAKGVLSRCRRRMVGPWRWSPSIAPI